jgi:hypothetical protein
VVRLTVTDNRGTSRSTTVTVVAGATNVRPIALISALPTAGPAPLLVQLNGSASSDPESTALTYRWSIVSQPAGAGLTISCATSGCSVTLAAAGAYVFRLTVTDGGGLTATDDVTIYKYVNTKTGSGTGNVDLVTIPYTANKQLSIDINIRGHQAGGTGGGRSIISADYTSATSTPAVIGSITTIHSKWSSTQTVTLVPTAGGVIVRCNGITAQTYSWRGTVEYELYDT